MMLIRFPLILATVLSAPSVAQTDGCTFPGAAHECRAPRGDVTIEWREPIGSGDHTLWLRRGSRAPVKLLDFGCHVDVLWSPDARAVAVTDYRGSSDSAIWIVAIDATHAPISVERAFIRSFGKAHALYQHGHRSFVARSWSSATTLVFEIRAHDAAPNMAFVGEFVYDLTGLVTSGE